AVLMSSRAREAQHVTVVEAERLCSNSLVTTNCKRTGGGAWVSKFSVHGTMVRLVLTELLQVLPAPQSACSNTLSGAPIAAWSMNQVSGQAEYSAPRGHAVETSPPMHSVPSMVFVSNPCRPTALYFDTSLVSRSTSVASPRSEFPPTGAPLASTSMHFSSPVKSGGSGGT